MFCHLSASSRQQSSPRGVEAASRSLPERRREGENRHRKDSQLGRGRGRRKGGREAGRERQAITTGAPCVRRHCRQWQCCNWSGARDTTALTAPQLHPNSHSVCSARAASCLHHLSALQQRQDKQKHAAY
eukprot:3098501-Rhodomonas_salina.3